MPRSNRYIGGYPIVHHTVELCTINFRVTAFMHCGSVEEAEKQSTIEIQNIVRSKHWSEASIGELAEAIAQIKYVDVVTVVNLRTQRGVRITTDEDL